MAASPVAALLLTDVAAIHLGVSMVLGSLAGASWVRAADSPWAREVRAQAAAARRSGAVLTLLALVCAVWLQAAIMGDSPILEAGPTAWALLRDTRFGHVAMAGWAAWLVVIAASWRADNIGPVRLVLTAIGLLALIWSRSAVSHAGSQEDLSIDVAIDMVHIAATCLWVGIVLLAASIRWPAIGASAEQRLDAARWVSALSSTATLTLVIVLLSGAFRIWRSGIDVVGVIRSDYGVALYSKLALVAVAVALGGFNRFRVLPGLLGDLRVPKGGDAHRAWHQRLTTVLRIEALVLVMVLLAAAVLAGTEPPGP
jgi:putative copper resistance protein D